MSPQESRYLRAVRRASGAPSPMAKLSRGVAAGAILVLPLACGNGDQEVFAGATTTTAAAAVSSETTLAPTTTTAPSTSASPVETTAAADTGVLPATAELLVSFSYEPSESNGAKRPYIAVWVEDPDGNLVDTISVWFDQGAKGTKWIDDLSQWYRASGGDDTTMSSATRMPGQYTVAWDGTNLSGDPVATGEYLLNIESAREHGPTSFTSGTIILGDSDTTLTLGDDGELSAASASLKI